VTRVTIGAGRHELTLDAGFALRAWLPLTTPPPPVGAEISVDIDPGLTAIIDSPPRPTGVRPR
jgi:hypothetical protein